MALLANPLVSEQDLSDAMNMAKARVYHYQSIGWTMFDRKDLVGAAYEGIAQAIIRFEPERGTVKETKFTSYAYFWIEKYIKEYITNNKTMLAGTSVEKWQGRVPYTLSIDKYDSGGDEAGSDHKDWLGTGVDASERLEHEQRENSAKALLRDMLQELEPNERLVMQLSLGIGTVYGESMEVTDIARACCMTRQVVRDLLYAATTKLTAIKDRYAKIYKSIL